MFPIGRAIVTDKLHITDAVYANTPAGGGVFVTYPSVSAGSATVEVKTNILNEDASAQNATLVSTILGAQGLDTVSQNLIKSAHSVRVIAFQLLRTVSKYSLFQPACKRLA
jgi:hypothetical protein